MRIAIILLLALAVPQFVADEPPTFEKYSPKQGKFTVLVPAKPEERTRELTLSNGGVVTSYRFTSRYKDTNFGGSYVDLPESPKLTDEERTKLLEGDAPELAKKLKGTVRFEKKIMYDKSPGRDIEVELPGDLGMRVRSYLIGNRLFNLVVTGKTAMVRSKEADKFLESFELAK